MAQIEKITEGMRGQEVSELLDGNFSSLNTDIQNLEKQLKDRGYVIINYMDSVSATRLSIPSKIRRSGLTITYNAGSGWIQEQYIAADTTDDAWQGDENWKSIGGTGSGFWVESNTDFTDKISAHNAIKENERIIGMYISYRLNGTWTTEQYVGIDTSKDNWENPDNWNILTYNEQIAEIAKQAQAAGQQAIKDGQTAIQKAEEAGNDAKDIAQAAADKADDAATEAQAVAGIASQAAASILGKNNDPFPINTLMKSSGAGAGNVFGRKWVSTDKQYTLKMHHSPGLVTEHIYPLTTPEGAIMMGSGVRAAISVLCSPVRKNEKIIYVGQNLFKIWYSEDNAKRDVNMLLESVWYGIKRFGDLLIALGRVDGKAGIAYSADFGETWIKKTLVTESGTVYDAVYVQGRYIFATSLGIFSSVDLDTFIKNAEYPTRDLATDGYAVVGTNSTLSQIRYTTDGVNWNLAEEYAFTTLKYFPQIGMFITHNRNQIMTSFNGVNWSVFEKQGTIEFNRPSIAYSPKSGIIVCLQGDYSLASNNQGNSWVYTGFGGEYDFIDCRFIGALFVAFDNSEGRAMYTQDGINFDRLFNDAFQDVVGITGNDNLVVILRSDRFAPLTISGQTAVQQGFYLKVYE